MPFEPRHTWLIFLSMIAFAGAACAAPPPDTLAQRLVACAACHGREGRATNDGYYPRIAGKPAGYLFNQLVNFRDGRRRNAAMTYLVNHQTDAYLREIAGHFAALDLPYPPPLLAKADPAVLARGERLVRQGDTARGIPACVACHGAELTGVAPAQAARLRILSGAVQGTSVFTYTTTDNLGATDATPAAQSSAGR